MYVLSTAAWAASLSLLRRAFSCSVILTNCWVSVDAPWVSPPWKFETSARVMPRGSTPPCSRKRLSSIAIWAFCMVFEMLLSGTMMRFSSYGVVIRPPRAS